MEIPSQHRRRRARGDMTPPRTSRVVSTPPDRGRSIDRPQTPQRRRQDTSAPPTVMTTSTTTTTTTTTTDNDQATITIHDGNARGSAPGAKSRALLCPPGKGSPGGTSRSSRITQDRIGRAQLPRGTRTTGKQSWSRARWYVHTGQAWPRSVPSPARSQPLAT